MTVMRKIHSLTLWNTLLNYIKNNEAPLSASACAIIEKCPEDWNEKQIFLVRR